MVDNYYQHRMFIDSATVIAPASFVYKFLTLSSGPTGTSVYDIDSDSSSTNSVYEFVVPDGRTFKWSRVNFILVDGSINPGDFGGIASGLTNGCLFEIIASDGVTQILDLLDTQPIKTNADFSPLAGSDVQISELAGDDQLPIRFTVAKAGGLMQLTQGQIIRWTVRDNLSPLTKFRAMVQGYYSV